MRRFYKELAFADIVFESDNLNNTGHLEELENAFLRRWCCELMSWDSFMTSRVHRRGEANLYADFLSRWCVSPTGYVEEEDAGAPLSSLLGVYRKEGGLVHAVRRAQRAAAAKAGAKVKQALGLVPVEKEAGQWEYVHGHTHSQFVKNVLAAQAALTGAQRQAYLALPNGHVEEKDWRGVQRVLLSQGRLLVPEEDGKLIAEVLGVLHDQSLHVGVGKVQEGLSRAKLFIPKAKEWIGQYVGSCPKCQAPKAPHTPQQHGPLLVEPRWLPLSHIQCDFASITPTKVGGVTYVGVLLFVDMASRVCQMTLVTDATAASAGKGLERWIQTWGPPVAVHSDRGSHFDCAEFRQSLGRYGCKQALGTAYHSRGRGMVERLVGKMKDGLRKLLPPGLAAERWPWLVGEVEKRVNALPHSSLGGISPMDYLVKGHALRVDPLAPLMGGVDNEYSEQQPTELLLAGRWVADLCGEISAMRRSMMVQELETPLHLEVGEWSLLYHVDKKHTLDTFFRGPYEVVSKDKGGFYTVREVLAGHVQGDPQQQRLGKPVECHGARLLPYNGDRTSPGEVHESKLNTVLGFHVVESIVGGPRPCPKGFKEQQFLVKWHHREQPTWEYAGGLRKVIVFREYCEARGLTPEGK